MDSKVVMLSITVTSLLVTVFVLQLRAMQLTLDPVRDHVAAAGPGLLHPDLQPVRLGPWCGRSHLEAQLTPLGGTAPWTVSFHAELGWRCPRGTGLIGPSPVACLGLQSEVGPELHVFYRLCCLCFDFHVCGIEFS